MGEIQRALNLLTSTVTGGVFALNKTMKPKTNEMQPKQPVYQPSLNYGSESASVYATLSANEAVKQKQNRAYSHVRSRLKNRRLR